MGYAGRGVYCGDPRGKGKAGALSEAEAEGDGKARGDRQDPECRNVECDRGDPHHEYEAETAFVRKNAARNARRRGDRGVSRRAQRDP